MHHMKTLPASPSPASSSQRWMQNLEQKVKHRNVTHEQNNNTSNHKALEKPQNTSHTNHRQQWQPQRQGDALVLMDTHAPVWSLEDFDVGKKLGEGQFGSVYLARERRSSFIVALKAIKKSQLLCSFNEHLLRREIDIHSHLLHPNILQFYTWFTTATRIYLVLEIAPLGELMDRLSQGGLPEHLVAKYMKQIISAIRCCHRHNVLHRDLKPENILIDIHGNLKLADFGWAAHVPSENTPYPSHRPINNGQPAESPSFAYLKKRRKTFCGTLDYLSPEICRHEWYGTEVDVWCLGVLCFELATGGPPFSHEPYQQSGMQENEARKRQQKDIQECDIKSRLSSQMSNELKDFLIRSLAKDPAKRLSTTQMLKHRFISRHCSLSDESDLSDDFDGGSLTLQNNNVRPASGLPNRPLSILRTEIGQDALHQKAQQPKPNPSAASTPRFGAKPTTSTPVATKHGGGGFQPAAATMPSQLDRIPNSGLHLGAGNKPPTTTAFIG